MAEYDKQYKAKTYNGVEYETDRDYASLAKAAANAGEYDLAKTYEQKRNAKIAGEGLNYETTNLYQDYMPEKQTSTSFDTTTTNKNYNSALNGVVNYQPFSYDVNTDPLYAQYQQQYTRNGQLASDNTLAQVSARTGGLASSYAGQAAQQTYNGYMQELNNKIPELYELAYNKYLQDFSMNQSKLAAQNEYENTLYSRQQDEYNKNMELAQLAAKYGDYSYLQNMGIDTSAMTATTGKGGSGTPVVEETVTPMSNTEFYTYMNLAKTDKAYAAQILSENYSRMSDQQRRLMASRAGMGEADLATLSQENASGLYNAYLNTTPEVVTDKVTNGYTTSELLEAAAAGMTKAQILEMLEDRGVDTTQLAVRLAVNQAISK